MSFICPSTRVARLHNNYLPASFSLFSILSLSSSLSLSFCLLVVYSFRAVLLFFVIFIYYLYYSMKLEVLHLLTLLSFLFTSVLFKYFFKILFLTIYFIEGTLGLGIIGVTYQTHSVQIDNRNTFESAIFSIQFDQGSWNIIS